MAAAWPTLLAVAGQPPLRSPRRRPTSSRLGVWANEGQRGGPSRGGAGLCGEQDGGPGEAREALGEAGAVVGATGASVDVAGQPTYEDGLAGGGVSEAAIEAAAVADLAQARAFCVVACLAARVYPAGRLGASFVELTARLPGPDALDDPLLVHAAALGEVHEGALGHELPLACGQVQNHHCLPSGRPLGAAHRTVGARSRTDHASNDELEHEGEPEREDELEHEGVGPLLAHNAVHGRTHQNTHLRSRPRRLRMHSLALGRYNFPRLGQTAVERRP